MNSTPLDILRCDLSGTSLIEASAGTGKTWNICVLYLRLLLQSRLDVSQILVVTFTNAATAELRDRIRRRISDTLKLLAGEAPSPDDEFEVQLLSVLNTSGERTDLRQRLAEALQRFDEAAIFTIHGYCERALRDTPLGAGMPIATELETEESALTAEVAGDFWRRRIAAGTLAPGLAAYLLEADDSPAKFANLLDRRIAKPLAILRWPEPAAGPRANETLQARFLAAQGCWQREAGGIEDCVRAALGRLNAKIYHDKAVGTASKNWTALFSVDHPLAASETDRKLELFTREHLKKNTHKGKQGPVPHRFFDLAQDLLDDSKRTRTALRIERSQLLREFLEEAPEALRRKKRARRVMSFDDLLSNLYERLTSGECPWLVQLLRGRFPAALIDEFQDTDPVQYGIFREIYSAPGTTLFLVGDPKQAIYSFRNADLRVYLRARAEATRIYSLAENQRSSRQLLDGFNALFGGHHRGFMDERLDYVPLVYGRKERPSLVDNSQLRAPLQLWSLPRKIGNEVLLKSEARTHSALASAAEIARLIAAGQRGEITLDGRNLGAGDIAVLVGTHRDGIQMREALAQLLVGSIELSRSSIFKSAEARDLERVLAAVLEPMRISQLRAAYATALMGGNATKLEALSVDDSEVHAKMARLADYREQWLQRGIGVMLRTLLLEEKIGARLLSMQFGERRLTNVLHLVERLHAEDAHRATPEVLLAWLQGRLSKDAPDESAELRLESERNLVQIVTIHRAKGLQYPIVFCPFLWDGSPGRSGAHPYDSEYHDEDGSLVMDFRTQSTDDKERIKQQNKADRLAERLRMIYVALTRAIHRCYVVVGNYSRPAGKGLSLGESRHGALPWLAAGEETTALQWAGNSLTPEDLDAAWQALADRGEPGVGYDTLPLGPAIALLPAHMSPHSVEILAAPAQILPGWRLGSYSQLIHGAPSDASSEDHDLRVSRPEAPDPGGPEPIGAEDILRFPRGLTAGHCIHAVFESVDFVRPDAWSVEIAKGLRAHPQAPRPGTVVSQLPGMLTNMLKDVLNTPLPGGFRLAEVPRARRLVELKFSLPVSRMSQLALRRILERHGHDMPRLNFAELRGYLTGAIDLVVEAANRYWVIDWKSNFLGATAAHYEREALEAAMDLHHYHLQYLLYVTALHRYLQRRLPGYVYDQHMGGAVYLFVRGVRPGWTGKDGRATGVYSVLPERALVEDLSALMLRARDVA